MKKLITLVAGLALIFNMNVAKADEGMWLLSLLKQLNHNKMYEMGCKLSAEDIYSVNQACIKDAIVGLGNDGRPFRHFCTGEIVSNKGLFITNHHCGFGVIQKHSTVEHDYLKDGFWAYSLDQELANPGITASILVKMNDVTSKVLANITDDMSERDRFMAIRKAKAQIAREYEKGTHYKASVKSIFNGNQYFVFVYEIFKDVRLVGAPPSAMGKFGGDTDNWMWPRHTADFSMFRIYTGKDGKPAKFSKDNIPYKPKHFLPISAKGYNKNDFAMILGFPGSTDRYLTSFGLKKTMKIDNTNRIKVRTEKLRIMKEEMNKDREVAIKYASKYAGSANYWKNSIGQNKALTKLNTVGIKEGLEKELINWINTDQARKTKYGKALDLISNALKNSKDVDFAISYYIEALFQGAETPYFALSLLGLKAVLESDKTSPEKIKAMCKALKEKAKSHFKDFNLTIDMRLFASLTKMFVEDVNPKYYPKAIEKLNKKYKGNFDKCAKKIFKKSFLVSEEAFNKFIENPTLKAFGKDPIFNFAISMRSKFMELRKLTGKYSVELDKGNRLFVAALLEMNKGKVTYAPDANSTLRLTYGKVGDYEPKDGVIYKHYTTIDGVIAKEDKNNPEFTVPERLKELYAKKDFGPYAKDGVLNACFTTDNDITGGNSGSPVINGNGELIGTAFDGNWEAMSGDIDFEDNLQKCINLDVRYLLFIVDKYAGAKNLIEEMDIRF